MSLSDHEYVNFSEDYEMDYHLRKAGKQQSAANRATLRKLGPELKASLGVTYLTHAQLHGYILENLQFFN